MNLTYFINNFFTFECYKTKSWMKLEFGDLGVRGATIGARQFMGQL